MVGGAGKTLEWVQSETTVLLPKDSGRCFKTGMRSSLSWGSDRWAVEVQGKSISHQLLEVVGSISGNSVIHEEQETFDSIPLYGQCLSTDIHQQERDGVQSRPFIALAKECWGLCMQRAIMLSAKHLPGCLNIIADEESRHMRDRWDWKLTQAYFRE